MGDQKVRLHRSTKQKLKFIEVLLKDIEALETMFKEGLFESGIQRIGVEQEVYLVDSCWRPSPVITEILQKLEDPHYTTELAKYNMEINLDPVIVRGACLSNLQKNLDKSLEIAREALSSLNSKPLLIGILPTLKSTDLGTDNMTPMERYKALDKILSELRGGEFEFRISGIDELITRHNSVMFESVNTSFQLHLQIDPESFVSQYNWAQAISGPVLSAATFSPILLGKKLWRETRIALFQQSIDIRQTADLMRERSPRVTFGNDWAKDSLVNIFKEDIVRHKILLSRGLRTDSMTKLERGEIPKLEALMVHNGTIYKWNRPCYGVMGSKPNIRIENRYLPSGPTITDEIANTAFWVGLMNGQPEEYKNISQIMPFDEAKSNFLKAARQGLYAQFHWINERKIPAQDLILNKLLPIAKEGLKKADIFKKDIDYYLGIIENRVRSNKTGSQWVLDSYDKLIKEGTKDEALVAITAGTFNRQQSGNPVHQWDLANIEEAGSWINYYWRIDQIMSTDLYAVNEEDYINLVSSIMTWKKVRHVPVENNKGKLVGLITSGMLVEYLSSKDRDKKVTIKEIMLKDPYCVQPDTLTIDALKIMKTKKIGCLPVVKNNRLVGIVTEHDFVDIAGQLLKELQAKGGE